MITAVKNRAARIRTPSARRVQLSTEGLWEISRLLNMETLNEMQQVSPDEGKNLH